MAWFSTKVIKKRIVFDTNPNVKFDIRTYMGNNTTNVDMIFTYIHLITNNTRFNTHGDVINEHPYYTIRTDDTISNRSIIRVFAEEI